MLKFFISLITVLCVSELLTSPPVLAQHWIPVRGGIEYGISGIALIEQNSEKTDFLIVHDNKKSNQGRLAIISIESEKQPEYLPLNLQDNKKLPDDLEALTTIPNSDNNTNSNTNNTEFIALSSDGKGYHIKVILQNKTASIIKEFNLPEIDKNDNFESFTLQKIDNQLIAVWAHRGEGKEPAKIYWGKFDINNYQINNINSATFTVPFPDGKVRHISDLKIDNAGIVYVSAANDNGDNGPFASAVYVAGYLGIKDDKKIEWRQNQQLFPIYHNNYHKIEGLEIIPGALGGIIVGTDDENMGASIYMIGE